jgi:hypothetical protein
MALAAEAASAGVALESGAGEVVATGPTMAFGEMGGAERVEVGWEEEGCVRRRRVRG